jgi:hypothetical protein
MPRLGFEPTIPVFEKAMKFSFLYRAAAVRDQSKTSLRAQHSQSSQPYGRKVSCVQRDIWFGHSGSHLTLRIESSNFPMMT